MNTSYHIHKDAILQSTDKGLYIFKHYIPGLHSQGQRRNIKAVFRDDGKNADASVNYSKEKGYWYYHDFVSGEHLSPFDFVMKWHTCDFKTALEIISRDILHNIPHPADQTKYPVHPTHSLQPLQTHKTSPNAIGNNTTPAITLSDNYTYWFQFAPEKTMTETLHKYRVKSLHHYQTIVKGKTYTIQATPDDPIFAFTLSETCYKLYRPHAQKQYKHLWLGNKPETYHNLYGLDQLPEHTDTILIVEGLKDTLVANANGIIAAGVDNAATRLQKTDIDFLKTKCQHLILCYDMDDVGTKMSQKASQELDLKRLQLPDGLFSKGGKDISDYFRLGFPPGELQKMIHTIIEQQPGEYPDQGQEPVNTPTELKQAKLSKFARVEQYIHSIYEIRYNEVSNEIECRKRTSAEAPFEPLNENNIFRFLQHNNIEFSLAKLTALLRSDFVPKYNPFNDYFEHLPPWDNHTDPDYIEKLCTYLKVKETQRFRIQFKKTMVRTIACALHHHVINKQAFILVHEEQNSGKSTFIRWLCPPALKHYMAENITTDKDSLICLSDNLIINMDELATLTKTEINSLKSMFSKETIKIRRPYDKAPTTAPRRASFFGSTNKTEFLTDETGSVRWLCFELTEKINWDYQADLQINDIWRQAYTLYKQGFKYELTPEEIRENEEANQQYQVTTLEIELIQKEFTPGNKDDHDQFYQATDILYMINQKYENMKLNLNNIGKALKILGFERASKRSEKYPIKGYYIKYKSRDVN